MPPIPLRTSTMRALAVAATVCASLAVGAGLPSQGAADVAADRAATKTLREQVAAETARIETTGAGLAAAEQRLAALDERANARQAQLKATQDALVQARFRLARLERKARSATRTLSKNLVAAYQTGTPDIISVVMDAKGFSELLEQVDFYKKVSRNNGLILDDTRQAKRDVAVQTRRLTTTRARYSALAAAAVSDRNRAAVVRSAILRRQQAQLEKRSGTNAKLSRIKGRIRAVERRQAAEARAAASANTATQAAPPTSGSANSTVDRVIAAANDIASTPYVWGGGHGGGNDSGYDCSGSVSYALAAGGLLSTPLDSTGFMSWGEAGPGRRITVYANAGHAFMYVDGRRFDTSALSGGGTRWSSQLRSTAGFVARHPAGY